MFDKRTVSRRVLAFGDPADPADSALLVRAGRGDGEAFMALYDRFAPRILGLLIKIMGNRADAEDAFQQTVLDIWRRAASYDESLGSAKTWILMVTRARGIDELRRRPDLPADVVRFEGNSRILPGTDVGLSGQSDRLRDALDALPQEQRTAIEMAFYRGLTREQAAVALGVPVGTVKTRIRLGVRALGGAIDEPAGRTR